MINTSTAVGKTVKVGVWLVVVNAVLAALSVLLAQPSLLDPKVMGAVSVINMVLVLLKNWADPSVKNF